MDYTRLSNQELCSILDRIDAGRYIVLHDTENFRNKVYTELANRCILNPWDKHIESFYYDRLLREL